MQIVLISYHPKLSHAACLVFMNLTISVSRSFQIIVFRVRLSCPWRKTDQKFRDQIKFLKLYSILCYICLVLQTAHLYYWQPTWPSHPVFLSGCFVVLFSKMKSVSSSKKQNCSHILFCWFVPLFHTLNSMCQFRRHFLKRLSWSMACYKIT